MRRSKVLKSELKKVWISDKFWFQEFEFQTFTLFMVYWIYWVFIQQLIELRIKVQIESDKKLTLLDPIAELFDLINQ